VLWQNGIAVCQFSAAAHGRRAVVAKRRSGLSVQHSGPERGRIAVVNHLDIQKVD